MLQDDIEIEPATQEFDVAVQKMLAEPLRRELDMLQRKMEGGHATDDDKERLRWLVGEISRRRRLV